MYVLVVLLVFAFFSLPLSADGRILVVHKWADSVGIYSLTDGSLISRIEVGKMPHEVVVSADGTLAYVTEYGVNRYTEDSLGGNAVAVINLKTLSKTGVIDLGRFRRPHGIEIDRQGTLYVTVDFPPALLLIDPISGSITRECLLSERLPHMVALSKEETKAYTANAGSGTVSVISLHQERPVKNIQVGGVPMGLAVSGDGKRVFVTTRTGNNVTVIDTDADEVVKQIAIPGQPVRMKVTPDGRYLLVTLIEAGEIAVVDLQADRVIRRIPAGTQVEGINTDSQGHYGYAGVQGEDKVIRFSLENWETVLTIRTESRPDPVIVLD
jgi:YVTN family beta-propeller protein